MFSNREQKRRRGKKNSTCLFIIIFLKKITVQNGRLWHSWGAFLPSFQRNNKTLNSETDIMASKFLFPFFRKSWSTHQFLPYRILPHEN